MCAPRVLLGKGRRKHVLTLAGCVRRRRPLCHGRHHRPGDMVQAELWLALADAVWHHDALHRVRPGRAGAPLPRLAGGHDLARQPRQLHPLLRPPRPLALGPDAHQRLVHQPVQVVPLGLCRLVCVVLVPRHPLPGPDVVLVDHLDLARQHRRQPAVWRL